MMSRRDRIKWTSLSALLFAAMMLDVATTHMAVGRGTGRELNPAMVSVVAHGAPAMIAVKLVALTLVITTGILTRRQRGDRFVLVIIALQSAVCVWNAGQLVIAH